MNQRVARTLRKAAVEVTKEGGAFRRIYQAMKKDYKALNRIEKALIRKQYEQN